MAMLKALRSGALALLLACSAAAHCQQPADAPQLAAAKRMLRAMGAGDIILKAMRDAASAQLQANPARAKLFMSITDEIDARAAEERMAPTYAKYMPAAQAEAVARFFESDTGRKAARVVLARAFSGTAEVPELTPPEVQELEAFSRSPEAQAWLEAQKRGDAELRQAVVEWTKELLYARIARDPGAAASLGLSTEPALQPFREVFNDFLRQAAALERKFAQETAAIDLESLLQPA